MGCRKPIFEIIINNLFFMDHCRINILVNEREISPSETGDSGWDRIRVKGYFIQNQRELFISMLFQCYLKMTHLHIHVHKNIYTIKNYNNTTNQISYSDT